MNKYHFIHTKLIADFMQETNSVRIANQHAMQDGITLGLFGLMTLGVFKASLTHPFYSTLFGVMLLGGPVLALVLTLYFRRKTTDQSSPFSFSQGFFHALFTGFYASIWVALGIFVYLQYFDHGSLFAAWQKSLESPAMEAYMQNPEISQSINEITNGKGIGVLGETMQRIGAANYAALSIYATIAVNPFIAIVCGLIARRSRRVPPPWRGL